MKLFIFIFITFVSLNLSAQNNIPKEIFITSSFYTGEAVLTMLDEKVIDKKLENEIVNYLVKEQGLNSDKLHEPYVLSEDLTSKVLKSYGIDGKEDSLFIYHTNDGHTSSHRVSELGKLKIQFFHEMKFIISNIGFSLKGIVKKGETPHIAYFGKENIFLEKELNSVVWDEGTEDMLDLVELSNKKHLDKDVKIKKFVTKDLRLDMTDISYKGLDQFKYRLRVSRNSIDFYDFDAGSDYSSRPFYIYVGKLFKNISAVAFIASNGLGKCTSLLYVDEMDELNKVELRCPAQEC
ncbi:hypothetical protein [Halobacteriovorax sp. YZS-1-1]|uniref:hypothetical protein n=1 Tax=unclassified Halobacteriovorax TaxID=2639665 RepID=UPI00399A3863